MKLLIALPLKAKHPMFEPENIYQERFVACQETWLKNVPKDGAEVDSPVYYRGFTDAELGLDPESETVRPWRTKLMAKHAYDNGYDYVFRVDTDCYVWVNRLLKCGFEQHDYMGYCLDYPKHLERHKGLRTAHGGIGFFLSRKAMEVVINTDPWPQGQVYWGDIWAGEALWQHGIFCHRDTRFMDGGGKGNWTAEEFPAGHPYIAVHPVPGPSMYAFDPKVSDESVPPLKPIYEWKSRKDICGCVECRRG